MTRRLLVVLCILTAALVAMPAAAPAKKAKVKRPVVTLVSPMRLEVGDLVVIRGRNFNKKARKNTVVFRAGGRSVLVKPIRATTKRLVVKVPVSVIKLFAKRSGDPISTRFSLQVLANKKKTTTRRRLSPVIVPEAVVKKKPAPAPKKKTGTGGTGTGTPAPIVPAGPPPPCGTGSDFDGNLLSNALESTLGTNGCSKDTDGDGVEDGFEYKSAIDLNDDEYQQPNASLPYPGQKPYPNPLDGTDAHVDYDGDSLTSLEEQTLWKLTITNGATRTLDPLTYSAGEKYSMVTRDGSGHRVPTLASAGYNKQTDFLGWATTNGYRQVTLENRGWTNSAAAPLPLGLVSYGLLDFNRDGAEDAPPANAGYFRSETQYYDFDNDAFLSDNERDEDGDGRTNYDETHGRMTTAYWEGCYTIEKPYRITYAGTSPTDSDSDNDGIRDGADDQDHDDIPNLAELSRNAASGLFDGAQSCKAAEGLPAPPATNHPNVYGRVNPFNPCLPATWSRTCDEHPGFEGGSGAPFDDSPDWYSLN